MSKIARFAGTHKNTVRHLIKVEPAMEALSFSKDVRWHVAKRAARRARIAERMEARHTSCVGVWFPGDPVDA